MRIVARFIRIKDKIAHTEGNVLYKYDDGTYRYPDGVVAAMTDEKMETCIQHGWWEKTAKR